MLAGRQATYCPQPPSLRSPPYLGDTENLGEAGVGLCHSPESDELQMSDNLFVSIYYPHQIDAYFL